MVPRNLGMALFVLLGSQVIYQATVADGPVCHDAYADLYHCKTAGACEDLDRPSCLVEADTVAMACPHQPLF